MSDEQFNSTIPIVDMQANQKDFNRVISEAFKTVGFVGIVNTGIQTDLINQVYTVFRQFFSQPLTHKLSISDANNSGERGYVNSSESPLDKDIRFKDKKEFVHFGKELSSDDQTNGGYLPNLWPSFVDLKTPTMLFYEKLSEFIFPIAQAIEQDIKAPDHYLQKMLGEGDHLFRAVYYESTGEEGAAPHTDSNFITFLPPATSKGLEVLVRGEWIPVIVPSNAMIVNIGSMAEHWTNGYYKAPYHRVVTEAGMPPRISIAFFVHSRASDPMGPLETTIDLTGGQRRYPSATRQELLDRRLIEMNRATEEKIIAFSKTGLIERFVEGGYGTLSECKKVFTILKEKNLASAALLKAFSKNEQ